MVDANGQSVGATTDPYNGMLVRKVGDDWITFQAPASGLTPYALVFFHSTSDCSDSRYLLTTSGQGYAWWAVVRGSTAFYAKLSDPNMTHVVSIHAYERVEVNQDPAQPGTCYAWEGGPRSMGAVTATTDAALGALTAPYHIQ